VKYDDAIYPGEVTRVVGSEHEVSVMVKAGNFWKWPNTPDKIFYKHDAIVQVISALDVAGSRGQFKFNDI
jgi:hypothetical protein